MMIQFNAMHSEIWELLQSLEASIPRHLSGLERLRFIGEMIVEKMIEEDRAALRNFIDNLLHELHRTGASDIDFGGAGCKGQFWMRLHSVKRPVEEIAPLTNDGFGILIQNLLTESQRENFYDHRNLDFSYTLVDDLGVQFHFRADAYLEMDSLAVNFRTINTNLRHIDGYMFHPYVLGILSLTNTKEGLILITGITGSGKSSTLDSIVDYNNNSIEGHIVIVASPLEFIHTSKRCLIRHREVGRDTRTFKTGTVEALRQDPDIIVVGEMRDPETITAALEAADSGHKVISTLHTSSCMESIERIIGEMPPNEQDRVKMRLGSVLKCVISQKLVPTLTGELTLAREVMVMLPSIQAAIRNNNIEEIYQMIGEGNKFGMITMEQHLKYLYSIRKISLQTAENYANNKRMMQQLLRAA